VVLSVALRRLGASTAASAVLSRWSWAYACNASCGSTTVASVTVPHDTAHATCPAACRCFRRIDARGTYRLGRAGSDNRAIGPRHRSATASRSRASGARLRVGRSRLRRGGACRSATSRRSGTACARVRTTGPCCRTAGVCARAPDARRHGPADRPLMRRNVLGVTPAAPAISTETIYCQGRANVIKDRLSRSEATKSVVTRFRLLVPE
jgi:hypothetical protein